MPVTVDDSGTVTGSGYALALYNSIQDIETAYRALPDPDSKPTDFEGTAAEWRAQVRPIVVRIKKAWGRTANAHEQALGELQRAGADRGDASVVLTASDAAVQRFATPLTGAKTVTLPDASEASYFRIVREATASGAGTLTVQSTPTKALTVGQWVDVHSDGTTWRPSAFGSL